MSGPHTDAIFLATHWPLPDVEVGPSTVSFPGRAVFRITSTEGVFAVKVRPDTGSSRPTDHRPDVLDFLATRGYSHAPVPLLTRGGEATFSHEGYVTSVMEHVPRRADEGTSNEGMWHDLGSAAGKLNSTAGYLAPFTIPVVAALAEVAEQAAGRPFERDLLRLLDRIRGLADGAHSLIHGEINPSNAGRRADSTIVLLDWDQAGTGPTPLEYGYPLITTFVSQDTHEVDVAGASAFYAAYAATGMTIDLEAGFHAALFHALRYMWFADVTARWERLEFAVRNESALVDLMKA